MRQTEFLKLFSEATPSAPPAGPNANNTISKALSFEELLTLSSSGKYPLYVKITNGDNTGINPNATDFYRFDFNQPGTKQIAGHENEVMNKVAATAGQGVLLYVDTVLKSRNIVLNNSGVVKPSHNTGDSMMIKLPSGVSVKSSTMSFDYPVMRLIASTKAAIDSAEGNIDVYGSLGKNLTATLLDVIPKTINGGLIFVDKHAPNANVALRTSTIAGSFKSSGISFGWKPDAIGSKQEDSALIDGSNSIPDFSTCRMKCSLMIIRSVVNFNHLPRSIAGSISLVGNNLQEIPDWKCDIGGNLVIAGNPIDFSKSKGGAVVHGDLIVSEKAMKQGGVTEEQLRKLFQVKGKVIASDDVKAINSTDDLFKYFQPGKHKTTEFFGMLHKGIEYEFGELGKATLGKLLTKITGQQPTK